MKISQIVLALLAIQATEGDLAVKVLVTYDDCFSFEYENPEVVVEHNHPREAVVVIK